MQVSKFSASQKAFLGVALLVIFTLPLLSFGKSGVIYVDKDAKGDANGSAAHPYKSISKALDKAKKGTEVRIKNGTYNENITIPSGVKVTSDKNDRNKVTIKSDNNNKPTVTMKQGTKISAVTVKEGRHGILIVGDAKAHIYNVTIKDSKRDGIHAEKAKIDESKLLLIDKSYIAKSKMAGVYSESRMITIINSDVDANALDGIELKGGSKAWIEKVRARWNGGSGLKAVVDGSSVWSKNSSFRNNQREGVEAQSFGGKGSIGIKKANIVGNARYGVAKIQRGGTFRGLELGTETNENSYQDNKLGNISGILQ